jgi:lysophospholipase L1-like esterase
MSEPILISTRAKLALLAGAMLMAFGVCEIAARLIFPAPQDSSREPRIAFQSQPWGGFVHLPNQKGWMDDGFVTINSIGLRGPEPETPRIAGHPRVLAIGDSTTFGLGVHDHETYVAQLQSRLRSLHPGAEAINAGISGYNLTLETGLLAHLAPTIDPDVVLVGVFWNDLPYESVSPDGRSLLVSSTSPTATAGGGASDAVPDSPTPFVPRTFRIGEPPSKLNRLLRSSRLLYVLRQRMLGFFLPSAEGRNAVEWEMALLEGKTSAAIDDAWSTVGRHFKKISAIGREHGIDIGVVIMPIRAQVEQDYPAAAYQTRTAALAGEAGLFVVDPLPAFRAQPDRAALFIPYDRMHYSGRGNEVLARAVFDVLRERPALMVSTH